MSFRTCIVALQLVLLCSIVSHAEQVEETMDDVIIEHVIFKDLSGKLEQRRLALESADLEGPSDWTQWQYNRQHTGYNDKDKISPPLELLWYHQFYDSLKGTGTFEPITVVGDRILLCQGGRYTRPSLYIRCLDATNGDVLWYHHLEEDRTPSQAGYRNGLVYIDLNLHSDSYMMAFELLTGEPVWKVTYRAQWQDPLCPVVYGNMLLFPAGTYGGLACVNATTGEPYWWQPGGDASRWTPCVYDDVAYTWLTVMFDRKRLVARNIIDSGAALWSEIVTLDSADIYGDDCISTNTAPALDTARMIIYLMCANRLLAADLNYQPPRLLWGYEGDFNPLYVFDPFAPVIYEDYVFAIKDGVLMAYNYLTGEPLWSYPYVPQRAFPPAAANGMIFVSSKRYGTTIIDIETGEVLWNHPASGYLTIANDRLYIAGDSAKVWAFGAIATDVADENPTLPREYTLHQNYPNPFNTSTTITYDLPRRSHVEITVYNVLGRKVTTLVSSLEPAGSCHVEWNGTDSQGQEVSSGMYFYRLKTEEFVETRKLLLLK